MKRLLWLLPLLFTFHASPSFATPPAQQVIFCNLSTLAACTPTWSVYGTAGTPAAQAFGKTNANFTLLFDMFGSGSNLATNGVADASDIVSLWSGCSGADPVLEYTGACGAGGGGSMVYPGAGIPNSTGSAWGTSITLGSNTILGNAGSGAAALTSQQAIGVLNSGTANAQTGTSYTPVLSDGNGEVTMSNAAANTFCIPPNSSVAYALGTVLTVQEAGAGVTTIAPAGTSGCSGTGVTVTSSTYGSSSSQTYSLGGIYGFIQIQQSATNTWNVIAWTVPPQSARSLLNALVALGSGTTLTPNCSGATNSFTATGNITVALPTGCTPYDGQTLQLHVVSGSAAETYTANAGYAANSTVSWPAATAGTSGYVDVITLIYSSSLSKWMLGAYTLGNH